MKKMLLSAVLLFLLAWLAPRVSQGIEWLPDTNTYCASQGKDCGLIDDGHGGQVDCGTCTGFYTCGGGDYPNVCGCTDRNCTGLNCGTIDRGCGLGNLSCGTCSGTDTCGGGHKDNVCGCTPKDCA